MTEKEIRILMLLMDVSQVSIARKCKVPRSYVHQVLTGERTFPRIRQAIAEAVGKSVEQIWPPQEKMDTDRTLVNLIHIKKDTVRQGKSQ